MTTHHTNGIKNWIIGAIRDEKSPGCFGRRPLRLFGFSLIEVLAAVAIIGIITFLAIPNIIRIRQESEQSLAESRVEALNLGMASLVQAHGPTAAADLWSGAANNQARYDLVRPYLAFAPATIASYLPSGYSATLPETLLPLSSASLALPVNSEESEEE